MSAGRLLRPAKTPGVSKASSSEATPATGGAERPGFLLSRRAMVLFTLAAVLMIAFAAVAVHAATSKRTGTFPIAPTPTALPRGSSAPPFSAPRLGGGRPVSLAADASGRPVVINFFASWCSDCRAELSAFATASRRAGARVAFIGLDTFDSAPGTAESLLRHAGDAYPVGTDHSGAVAARYRIPNGLPVTYFLNAEHDVVGEALGQQSTLELDHWVNTLERSGSSASRDG